MYSTFYRTDVVYSFITRRRLSLHDGGFEYRLSRRRLRFGMYVDFRPWTETTATIDIGFTS